jgi:hypothetical protein
VLKEFFTRNVGLKILALLLAVILWAIARFWVLR